jgi:hypothetical protein
LATIVSSSFRIAKSKVIYGPDNIAIPVWGTRDDKKELDEGSCRQECPQTSEEDGVDDTSESESCHEGTESEE